MKVTIEIDCTPSEARRFLGFPDLEPLQEALMKRFEEQALEQIATLSPEGLLRSWFSAGALGAERMQDIVERAFNRQGGAETR